MAKALWAKVAGSWGQVSPPPPPPFNDATGGHESTYVLNGKTWKLHDFLTSGQLTVTKGDRPFRVFCVGAGTTGGNRGAGAGGEVVDNKAFTLAPGTYDIDVAPTPLRGVAGGPSGIRNFIDARGATPAGEYPNYASGTSGNGNLPGAAVPESSGGGGGAGGPGLPAVNGSEGGKGGPGVISDIFGVLVTFGAGGGGQGGGQPGDDSGGVGEFPRGGPFNPLSHAPEGRGGGGGAGYGQAPGNGGSGRVCIAYEVEPPPPFDPATANDATGGTVTDVVNYNGTGQTWRVHELASGNTFTVLNSVSPFRLLAYAAGGGGGIGRAEVAIDRSPAGGGGGGQAHADDAWAPAPGDYPVSLGLGGASETAGQGTTFAGLSLMGGGAGSVTTPSSGWSGGGAKWTGAPGNGGGKGGNGANGGETDRGAAGGGGGATGPGADATYPGYPNAIPGIGGTGVQSDITGQMLGYCGGGGGAMGSAALNGGLGTDGGGQGAGANEATAGVRGAGGGGARGAGIGGARGGNGGVIVAYRIG